MSEKEDLGQLNLFLNSKKLESDNKKIGLHLTLDLDDEKLKEEKIEIGISSKF